MLDGPGTGILDVDGAALAPDGTGGVVYRKLLDGVAHVFVSRYSDGRFEAPIQVDVGQAGPATMPAIAAGKEGRLLVVWVQPWASESAGEGQVPSTHYQLMSALLAPGAKSFGPAMEVDPKDIGNGTAAYPSLSMAPDGIAYVAYRVVTNPLSPYESRQQNTITPMRPGDELVDVRVARFNGQWWSSLGAMNGLPGQVTMRRPSATNAPVVAVDSAGEAVVVWQEPTIDGVARIWARRLFGTTKGNVLEVSPHAIGGHPVSAEADASALSIGTVGGAVVAFRLDAGQPLGGSHIFVNSLPPSVSKHGGTFMGARMVASTGPVSPPSVSFNEEGERFDLAFTAGSSTQLVGGSSTVLGTPIALGAASGEAALTTLDPSGGNADAWLTSDASGQPIVQMRESFGEGGWQTADLSAPLSGPIDSLAVGPSGLGDALVAFQQGTGQYSEVVATVAKAPPGRFAISSCPLGWVKGSKVTIGWEPAPNAIGDVTYELLVDGQARVRGIRGLSAQLNLRELGDGTHHVQVLAIDQAGQRTLSSATTLQIDNDPPLASARRLSALRVRVKVSDDASGAKAKATVIEFGDGSIVRGRLTVAHAYRRPGRYVITVLSEDNVGNRGDAHIRVQIR